MARHRRSFTDEALERSALAAGYSSAEFAEASALLDVREATRAALEPVKSTARRSVLAAYGVVWLLFALAYLGPAAAQRSFGPTLQLILTISLGVALAISLVIVGRGRPDPERRSRAVALLLAVPVILLLGVAGLCLPFTSGVVL
jgi:hypothetical protein